MKPGGGGVSKSMNNPMQVLAEAHSGHSSNPKSMIDVRSSMTPRECGPMMKALALPARPQQAKEPDNRTRRFRVEEEAT